MENKMGKSTMVLLKKYSHFVTSEHFKSTSANTILNCTRLDFLVSPNTCRILIKDCKRGEVPLYAMPFPFDASKNAIKSQK